MPSDYDVPGKIFFMSGNSDVIEVFRSKIVERIQYRYEPAGYIAVATENVRGLLMTICRDLQLSDIEKQDINAVVLSDDEELDVTHFSRIVPLERLCNIAAATDLIEVLKTKSITTHFQPIVEIESHAVFAHECLLRGVRSDGTLIPPNVLLEQATRADLTFNLDRLARETALKTAAVKRIDVNVFINFLPSTIYDPENCLKSTVEWAERLDFDFRKIVFEVVETERITDVRHLIGILNYYHDRGFRVALDDVGSGYSSLNMLADIKPDFIKIDMNLIRGIDRDEMKQSIFRALMDIARQNSIKVLAEGVETPEELAFLRRANVDLAQGYLFAKPSAEPIRDIDTVR